LRHDPASPIPPRGKVGLARWRVPSRKAYPHGFKTAFYLTSRKEMGARPDWAEMLRLDEDGAVVDGFASTPLLVERGRVLAPPRDRLGLEGVTFGRILSVCPKLGMKVVRRSWRPNEIKAGKCELLFVGSGVGILSADRFLGKDLGPPGRAALRLWRVYRDWIDGLAVRGGSGNAN
jgi:branched-subunit amino acid aminotransferase/4-amino-4-deoxychorismate lyase